MKVIAKSGSSIYILIITLTAILSLLTFMGVKKKGKKFPVHID